MNFDPNKKYFLPFGSFLQKINQERLYWHPLFRYVYALAQNDTPSIQHSVVDTAVRNVLGVMTQKNYSSIQPGEQAGFEWLMYEALPYNFQQARVHNPLLVILSQWVRAKPLHAKLIVELSIVIWQYLKTQPQLWLDAKVDSVNQSGWQTDTSWQTDMLLMDRATYEAYSGFAVELLATYPFLSELFNERHLEQQLQIENDAFTTLLDQVWAWLQANNSQAFYIADRVASQISPQPNLFDELIVTPSVLNRAGCNLYQLVREQRLQRYINSADVPELMDAQLVLPQMTIYGQPQPSIYPTKLKTYQDQLALQQQAANHHRAKLQRAHEEDDPQCYPTIDPYSPIGKTMNPHQHFAQPQTAGVQMAPGIIIPNMGPGSAPNAAMLDDGVRRVSGLQGIIDPTTGQQFTAMGMIQQPQQLQQRQAQLLQYGQAFRVFHNNAVGPAIYILNLQQVSATVFFNVVALNKIEEQQLPFAARVWYVRVGMFDRQGQVPAGTVITVQGSQDIAMPHQQQQALQYQQQAVVQQPQQSGYNAAPMNAVNVTVTTPAGTSQHKPVFAQPAAALPKPAEPPASQRPVTSTDSMTDFTSLFSLGELVLQNQNKFTAEQMKTSAFDLYGSVGFVNTTHAPLVMRYLKYLRFCDQQAKEQAAAPVQAPKQAMPPAPPPAQVTTPAAQTPAVKSDYVSPTGTPVAAPTAFGQELSRLAEQINQFEAEKAAKVAQQPQQNEVARRMAEIRSEKTEHGTVDHVGTPEANVQMRVRLAAHARARADLMNQMMLSCRLHQHAVRTARMAEKLIRDSEGLQSSVIATINSAHEIVKEIIPVDETWTGDENPLLSDEEKQQLAEEGVDHRVDVKYNLTEEVVSRISAMSVDAALNASALSRHDMCPSNELEIGKPAPMLLNTHIITIALPSGDTYNIVDDFLKKIASNDICTVEGAQKHLADTMVRLERSANDEIFDPADVDQVGNSRPMNEVTEVVNEEQVVYLRAIDTVAHIDRILTEACNRMLRERFGIIDGINCFTEQAHQIPDLLAHLAITQINAQGGEAQFKDLDSPSDHPLVQAYVASWNDLAFEPIKELIRTHVLGEGQSWAGPIDVLTDDPNHQRMNAQFHRPMVVMNVQAPLVALGIKLPSSGRGVAVDAEVSMLFGSLATAMSQHFDFSDIKRSDQRPYYFDGLYVQMLGGVTVKICENPLAKFDAAQKPYMVSRVPSN